MISSSFKTQIPQHTSRLQAGAAKFFEEADGDTALVPGMEDSCEDLAVDFLEGWLSSKPSFEMEQPAPQPQKTVAQPSPEANQEKLFVAEPKFTTFHLGEEWNLA